MIEYVAGLLFNRKMTEVVLVEKHKGPPELCGFWNGVGGKVEEGEGLKEAMIRNFEEQAGLHFKGWQKFLTLGSPEEWVVHWYMGHCDHIYDVVQMEEEPIGVFDVDQALQKDCYPYIVPNVRWILPLAKDINSRSAFVQYY